MSQLMIVRGVRLVLTYGLILIGLVLLVQRDYLAAIMAASLGSGFWLSMDTDPAAWQRRPRWQQVLAVALMLLSFALLIAQIV